DGFGEHVTDKRLAELIGDEDQPTADPFSDAHHHAFLRDPLSGFARGLRGMGRPDRALDKLLHRFTTGRTGDRAGGATRDPANDAPDYAADRERGFLRRLPD